MTFKILHTFSLSFLVLTLGSSCTKFYPEDRDSIDPGAQFLVTTYSPTLGRNTVYNGNFSSGTSSQPLEFEVLNLRRYNGDPAPELTDSIYKVLSWKNDGGYTGAETSLAEIEAKRVIENHRIFEVRKNSGQVVIWSGMDVNQVLTRPDSGYKFDVKVSNSGASRYYYNLRFIPRKPIPYEPSNYNSETGMTTGPAVAFSTTGNLTNVFRNSDNVAMQESEVDVYFSKKGNGNSLTFRFLDSAFRTIDPHLFNSTNWNTLIHGFDVKVTNTSVTYTVAYPIPLIPLRTMYTNSSGNRASINLSYFRKGRAGAGVTAGMGFDFSIFEKGDWEISFQFKNTSPKFSDD